MESSRRIGLLALVLLVTSVAKANDRVPAPQSGRQGMVVEPTLPVATDVPDRILASWKGDPATSFAVTWRSKAGAEAVGEIALATPGPEFLQTVERAKGDTSPLNTNLGVVHMHAVSFEHLKPDTLYTYRVGSKRTVTLDDESAKEQHEDSAPYAWSEWFQFRTAKPFDGTASPTTFVYVGDAQNDIKSHWSRLIRESYRDAPRMTFMLHAGDLVNKGNNDHEWGEWFHSGSFLFATIAQLAVPGNHEYDRDPFREDYKAEPDARHLSRRWAQRFEFPENGPKGFTENAYFIDVQGIRIVGLDSPSDQKEAQMRWLDEILTDNPNRWTIVCHHHPIYSTSRGRDNEELRGLWQPVYEKHGVDLVLQGHDHSYGRSGPILRNGRLEGVRNEANEATGLRVVEPNGGPIYVVSVSGPKMYPLKEYPSGQNPFVKHVADTQLYQVIDVTHNELKFAAKTPTGETIDSFRIVKDAQGQKQYRPDEDGIAQASTAE